MRKTVPGTLLEIKSVEIHQQKGLYSSNGILVPEVVPK
jgi:hypothetical protein